MKYSSVIKAFSLVALNEQSLGACTSVQYFHPTPVCVQPRPLASSSCRKKAPAVMAALWQTGAGWRGGGALIG